MCLFMLSIRISISICPSYYLSISKTAQDIDIHQLPLLLKKRRARYILHICSRFGIPIQIDQTRTVLVIMARTVKQKKNKL
jgi:hypothetical protein